MCVLFEMGRGFLEIFFFQNLVSVATENKLTPKHLQDLKSPEIINYISTFADKQNFEFYIYKLNLFQIVKEIKIKIHDFLRVLEFNLNQIKNLDEGDIIGNFLYKKRFWNIYIKVPSMREKRGVCFYENKKGKK